MEILGYVLAAIVGVSLGLIGSGGSILTVPILVYIMGINPVDATAYSLFIVGITALVGGIKRALVQKVDIKAIVVFAIPSIAVVYITRFWIMPFIPDHLLYIGHFELTKSIALLLLFAIVMIFASVSMIRPFKETISVNNSADYNYPLILIQGALVGLLTGLVGAGGGFLIIPALVLLTKMPMKEAVGSSLFIVASNALIGFGVDVVQGQHLDWTLLLGFTFAAIVGIFIGVFLSKKIASSKLKTAFGWFVLAMGIYILYKEMILPSLNTH
ncbi:MAG: sulfite exporter TauE/SafE family protein [Ferruginibacter sp.]